MVGNKKDDREINALSKKLYRPMDQEITRSIVADYIKHRLQCNGYIWENDGRHESVTPNSVQNAMRILGDEFEERFSDRVQHLIDNLVITDDNSYDTFSAIVTEIFSDDINWGRIVALFGFSGRFAVRCYQLNKPHLVDNLLEWLTTYIDIQLSSWMNSHNNWEGFLEFKTGRGENRIDISWPSFKTFLGCAAAGLGALTLGALFAQKS